MILSRFSYKKKSLLTTITLALFITILLYLLLTINNTNDNNTSASAYLSTRLYYYIYPKRSIQCYHYRDKSTTNLPDISREQPPRNGRSIFFHETSCESYFNGNKISISARQACAVESAAKLNPNTEVYLLFASPGTFQFTGTESDRFLQALQTYGNVHVLHLDYENYTKNTPVENLYRQGSIEASDYAHSHASDLLR